MKKMLKLEGKNMLNKEQLREIKGGYDCGGPDGCGDNGYYTCTIFGADNWMNCIGGVWYSCTYLPGQGCTWHP